MLGAIYGDVLGSVEEFEETKYEDISKIKLFSKDAHITDDSVLTCAVAEWFYKAEEENIFDPINSYGNGSAMRVSPVGWFFDTLEETMRFAKLSADVTHNHPEGEKGAMAIAASVFLARKGYSKEYIKNFVIRAFGYSKIEKSVEELRHNCNWNCTCQETVPLAIVAFMESFDYESAIRLAFSFGCDVDTVACMAGAIAEAYYKHVPKEIDDFCKKQIPKRVFDVINEFKSTIK